MKILIPTHIFSDVTPNGLMVVTWNIVNALAKKGVTVYVVSMNTYLKNIEKKDLNPNIKLHTIGSCRRNMTFDKRCVFYAWLYSIFLVVFKKIDFICVLDSVATPFSRFKIRPLAIRVIKSWDYGHPVYGQDLLYDRKRKREEEMLAADDSLAGKIFDFLVEKIFKLLRLEDYQRQKADVVFYQTKELAKTLPPAAVYLPNSVEQEKFRDVSCLKNKNFIFLFVGHLGKRKGVEYLIQAFNKLSLEYQNTELWFIGSGAAETIGQFKKQAQNQKIKFLGRILTDQIKNYFCQGDVFILPSLGESFPTAVLEAMACGKPVITTEGGGISDFFINGRMGFLIKPAEVEALYSAMKKLYLDPALAEKMGRLGREYVLNNLTSDQAADIIIKAFANLKAK